MRRSECNKLAKKDLQKLPAQGGMGGRRKACDSHASQASMAAGASSRPNHDRTRRRGKWTSLSPPSPPLPCWSVGKGGRTSLWVCPAGRKSGPHLQQAASRQAGRQAGKQQWGVSVQCATFNHTHPQWPLRLQECAIVSQHGSFSITLSLCTLDSLHSSLFSTTTHAVAGASRAAVLRPDQHSHQTSTRPILTLLLTLTLTLTLTPLHRPRHHHHHHLPSCPAIPPHSSFSLVSHPHHHRHGYQRSLHPLTPNCSTPPNTLGLLGHATARRPGHCSSSSVLFATRSLPQQPPASIPG